jgi:CHAT domain
MERADTIIPARMSLNVRVQPSQLECAFTVDGREFRTATPLFSDKLLSDHHKEVVLATQGFRPSSSVAPFIRRELQRIIPRPAKALLRDVALRRPEATAIALEIKLNDPLILERYPWELLAGYKMLPDRKVAVIVWRSVATPTLPRRPSSSVLLVGSASFDTTSTNAAEEIAHLARLIDKYSGIHPYPRPSITFTGFASLLLAIRPSVIHIVTHGDIRGFQFQEESEFSSTHFDILPQELAGYLATSPTANLTVLNACDSANSWDYPTSMARQIATSSSTTTIGMSTEIPNTVGAAFSKNFFHALVAGCSTIGAFGRAVEVIRRAKKFTTLWSVPIMYAPPDSNVILFPADPLGRIRLRFQELGRQLNQLETEAAGLIDNAAAASTPKRGLGVAAIRLAYVRHLIDDLEQPSTLQEPEYVYPKLLLRQTRNHSIQALEELSSGLRNLQNERRPGRQPALTARSIQQILRDQASAFARVERAFTGSR